MRVILISVILVFVTSCASQSEIRENRREIYAIQDEAEKSKGVLENEKEKLKELKYKLIEIENSILKEREKGKVKSLKLIELEKKYNAFRKEYKAQDNIIKSMKGDIEAVKIEVVEIKKDIQRMNNDEVLKKAERDWFYQEQQTLEPLDSNSGKE